MSGWRYDDEDDLGEGTPPPDWQIHLFYFLIFAAIGIVVLWAQWGGR